MTTSVCKRCGAGFFRPGSGRPRVLCDECRGGPLRYGGEHKRIRAANLADAYGTACARCGLVMREGQQLALDHRDGAGPGEYMPGLFSHLSCNSSAGGKRNRLPLRERERPQDMLAKPAERAGPSKGRHLPAPGCHCFVPGRTWWPRHCDPDEY